MDPSARVSESAPSTELLLDVGEQEAAQSSSAAEITPLVQSSSVDAQRKEQLRKAGKEYFEKALAQAGKGMDPFSGAAPPMTRQQKAHQSGGATEDPDVVAFGKIYDSAKLYVYMTLYVICQSASFLLVKVWGGGRCGLRLRHGKMNVHWV